MNTSKSISLVFTAAAAELRKSMPRILRDDLEATATRLYAAGQLKMPTATPWRGGYRLEEKPFLTLRHDPRADMAEFDGVIVTVTPEVLKRLWAAVEGHARLLLAEAKSIVERAASAKADVGEDSPVFRNAAQKLATAEKMLVDGRFGHDMLTGAKSDHGGAMGRAKLAQFMATAERTRLDLAFISENLPAHLDGLRKQLVEAMAQIAENVKLEAQKPRKAAQRYEIFQFEAEQLQKLIAMLADKTEMAQQGFPVVTLELVRAGGLKPPTPKPTRKADTFVPPSEQQLAAWAAERDALKTDLDDMLEGEDKLTATYKPRISQILAFGGPGFQRDQLADLKSKLAAELDRQQAAEQVAKLARQTASANKAGVDLTIWQTWENDADRLTLMVSAALTDVVPGVEIFAGRFEALKASTIGPKARAEALQRLLDEISAAGGKTAQAKRAELRKPARKAAAACTVLTARVSEYTRPPAVTIPVQPKAKVTNNLADLGTLLPHLVVPAPATTDEAEAK